MYAAVSCALLPCVMLRISEYLSRLLREERQQLADADAGDVRLDRLHRADRRSRSPPRASGRTCRGAADRPTSRSGSTAFAFATDPDTGGPLHARTGSPCGSHRPAAADQAGPQQIASGDGRAHGDASSRPNSVPVLELRAVDQRPREVEAGPRTAPRRRPCRPGGRELVGGREAREDREVERLDDLARLRGRLERARAGRGPPRACAARGSSSGDAARWADVGRLSRCSDSRPVSRGDRPNSSRKGLVMLESASAIARCAVGMIVKGSGILLVYSSVVPVTWLIASIRTSGSSRRTGYQANSASPRGSGDAGTEARWYVFEARIDPEEALQVVARGDEFPLEEREHLGVRGRVVGAQVVGLVDDPGAEEPRPDAVRDAAREPRVLRVDQPVGEHLARVPVRGQLRGHAVREDRGRGRRRPSRGRRRRSPPSTRPSPCSRSARRTPPCPRGAPSATRRRASP